MMQEIQIGWEAILPFMFGLRLVSFIVGCAVYTHYSMMAGFMSPEKTSWTTAAIIGFNGGAGMALIVGALSGDLKIILFSAIGTSATLVTMALWLWLKGFHVNKFLRNANHS